MRIIAIAIAALLLAFPASAQTTPKSQGNSTTAPGQTGKDLAPGQNQTKPGDAKTVIPALRSGKSSQFA